MKKLLFTVTSALILIINLSSFTTQEAPDTKAKAILDELSTKTKSYGTIKAEFELVLENKEKKKETQTGALLVKGDKYKIDIKGQEIISDGKTVWTYLKDAKEVQVNNIDETNGDAINPSKIFTLYETGFKYKFDKEETQGASTVQIINLYPLNPDKRKFHTIKLMINKAKKQITAVKLLMKDGGTVTYNIKSFAPNIEITDAAFTFDIKSHPGVEVVDLRE